MAKVQVALVGVVVLLRVAHMGFDVTVVLDLACCAPHSEAEEHEPDMAMPPIVETLDVHSSSCHAPIAVREIADAMHNRLVMHRTVQWMALSDRMQRPQFVPEYSWLDAWDSSSEEAPVCSESGLEALDQARVPSCPEVP